MIYYVQISVSTLILIVNYFQLREIKKNQTRGDK